MLGSRSALSTSILKIEQMDPVATSHIFLAKGGGIGSHGEDPFPWLTEFFVCALLRIFAFGVVGALWRYFTRPSAADLARERSTKRLSERKEMTRHSRHRRSHTPAGIGHDRSLGAWASMSGDRR